MSTLEESHSISNNVDISIIIPAYNLGKQIILQLERLKTILHSNLRYEIIVVNDGSTDNTLYLLEKEAESDVNIRLISYAQNKGKGYALRKGVLTSSGSLAMLLDGDCEISLASLNEYLNEIEGSDLVIGSKRHPLSNVDLPFIREFLSRTFNIFVRFTTGIKIKDTQVGLKVGKGTIIREIFRHVQVKRYAFDVELLTIASLLSLKVKEMPVDLNIECQFRLREIAKMFVDVLAVSYKYRLCRSYHRQLLSKLKVPYHQEIISAEQASLPKINL
jgi:glycosyltransferase involved in cell wall biosynthesis